MPKVKVLIVFATVLIMGFSVVGCGSKADKELTDAEDALRSAQEAGAENTPSYQEAEDLIARAKELMASGQQNEARSLLEEARFKAIAAKGEALSGQYMAGKTDAELQAEADYLASQQFQSSSALQDVFFNYDSASVRSDARGALDGNASYIIKNSGSLQLVAVEGYCDVRGTEEYNLALGQRRAESVKSYLVGIGVSPAKIQAISKGETEQWAAGASEYAYQQNRRAHFVTR
ncbi:MAG: OmpA family protein [Thermodesulfobacteriota bacterium]